MNSKAVRVALVAAVLFASGAHWVVLQAAAWTAMAWNNAREMAVGEAVARAFDGRHLCGMCRLVEKGAGEASDQAERAAPAGVDWIAVPPAALGRTPLPAIVIPPAVGSALSASSPPSTPPPRALRA